jgi:hypothetical protein
MIQLSVDNSHRSLSSQLAYESLISGCVGIQPFALQVEDSQDTPFMDQWDA